ncbi:MAG: DUF58 domain-containing protein [Alistipes sp.]|jgi:uncharacterized protein (DUF58 family)|nr:DUF58 domain-containing protein [Alistipes sp.]
MTSEELLKRVRKIEIKARKLSRNIFAGEYHSQFKGRGMAFSEVREYQPGDDVRSIDWNVTARLNKPYIKVFEEERELTVMLLVDVSGSRHFGTLSQMKRDMMAEVAATLAFSTIANNDKVGVIFFSDKIEKFIPAKKGKTHVLHIIRELLSFEPTSAGTDIAQALQYFANAQKRHCTAFLISDFIGAGNMYQPLMIASNRHEVNAIQIYDRREAELPNIGLVKFHDAETGNDLWVDTAITSVRDNYAQAWRDNQNEMQQLFTRTGVSHVSVRTDEDYVKALMHLFKC